MLYARASAVRLPVATGSVDAVVACLVFEHLPDHVAPLQEVARVLRPGGRFVWCLNHPLLQTPDRVDRRPHPRRAVLAGRALSRRRREPRRVGARSRASLRPPPARPICEHDDRIRAAALPHGRTGAAAGIPGAGPRIRGRGVDPRLLVLVAERPGNGPMSLASTNVIRSTITGTTVPRRRPAPARAAAGVLLVCYLGAAGLNNPRLPRHRHRREGRDPRR